MSKVRVNYADYNANLIESLDIPLFKDISFEIKVSDKDANLLSFTMSDDISSNVELGGLVDLDTLNSLLKALSTIKKQMERG